MTQVGGAATVALALTSGGLFTYYGIATLFAQRPRAEYLRYGLPRLRPLVGTLQLLGGTGVVLGVGVSELGAAAATGLAAMMLLALVVRVQLRDGFVRMIPAASLLVLNGWLALRFAAA